MADIELRTPPQSTETTITLPLSGLNCMNCARKVMAAVEPLDGVTLANADTTSLTINADAPLADVISAVEGLGYKVADTIALPLAGLSCGRCVAKLKAAFEAAPGVYLADVEKNSAVSPPHFHVKILSSLLSKPVIRFLMRRLPKLQLKLKSRRRRPSIRYKRLLMRHKSHRLNQHLTLS